MATRNVITRSRKTMRVKFPSRKNNCMVFCESLLERDVVRWLELSPNVVSYREQPVKVSYYDQLGNHKEYVPDFEVIFDDESQLHIEVKPANKLKNKALQQKYLMIAQRYEELGLNFQIITDEYVRAEPLLSNLQMLAYHSRRNVDSNSLDDIIQKFRSITECTMKEAVTLTGDENTIYWLIGRGYLKADLNQPLNQSSMVRLRKGDQS